MDSKTILIALRDACTISIWQQRLEKAGYRVLLAHDGREAYELVHTGVPHLVITEYALAYLGGLELSTKLYLDPITRGIPVILLAGEGYHLVSADLPGNIRHILRQRPMPGMILPMVQEIEATCGALEAAETGCRL